MSSSSFSIISNLLPSPHSNIHNFHTFFISNHNKPQTSFLISKFSHHSSNFHNTLAAKHLRSPASILPGGDWWTLPNHPEEDDAEPTAAMLALRRMWDLVADERWVALGAFGSLVIAAVSSACNRD
ncbi:ABC transporter B family member chloroplastic-like [Trifolium pratense]|uniref:ABC transporter B family member chloroplastic-like n=1 Tax=Trifolium pratense TaxID=57577 RepID=A0A2K3L1L6_TRIPR|nr:ABC transporter B family member chloroplastic-like [Trifolium pratense]